MEYVQYLREMAKSYREEAARAATRAAEAELLALAIICEDVATAIEDRLAGG
jgi:hypothetical protein